MPPSWQPDWQALMAQAPELALGSEGGFVYLVADSHLGDVRAPVEGFLRMLAGLEQPRAVVFLGDLFRVWLTLPQFQDDAVRAVLAGFQALRARGARVVFVVGNREFFLPRTAADEHRRALPFDLIVPNACVIVWHGRRYGLSHGDLVNRADSQYLKWRRVARGRGLEAVFRAIPGPLARRLAQRLERSFAHTNQDIKIQYPRGELEAFAQAVLPGLDGFFIGHFHRDETIALPGRAEHLRIVPDWHARKAIVRLEAQGREETLRPEG
jgi:UDP-2,3-diacylglucosamine hydrolase